MRKVLIIAIILLCIIPNCFAEIVSVSIENNIAGKINKIVIVPYNDKKEREEKNAIYPISCSLGKGAIRSFDLDNRYSYEIQLFDTAERVYTKSSLYFKDVWQKITFTDKDFKAKNIKETIGKFLGLDEEKEISKTNTCAVIISNKTGKTIEDIVIEQNENAQHFKVQIKNGTQKTIDIEKNTSTIITINASKKEYVKTDLNFNSEYEILPFSQEDCTEKPFIETVKETVKTGVDTVTDKAKSAKEWVIEKITGKNKK